MAVLLPKEISAPERRVVLDTVSTITELRAGFGLWRVAPLDPDDGRITLQPFRWMRPAQTWATVTPYVFDRYPDDPYGAEAQGTVRASFERAGFPQPASVSLMRTSVLIGVPPAPRFPAAPSRPGKPRRFHIHALVTFDKPVRGPMAAGAGRFYGYGFFCPLGEGI
jgi:CRISPR-associated protein Csb2